MNFKLLMALEIDGPNVNKSFKSTLVEELKKEVSHTS